MRHSSIFKSRYMALLWAAGILWFAYDTAGTSKSGDSTSSNQVELTDATGAPISADDEKALRQALNNF